METILKDLETADKASSNLECSYDGIGLIAYIATLTDDITSNELESASKIIYHAITNTFEDSTEIYVKLLRENDEQSFVTLSKHNANFKINVRSNWLFEVILLSATKYVCEGNRENSIVFFNSVVKYIIKYTFIEKPGSVHLLRTLSLILTKKSELLIPPLNLVILKCMNKVALSPISYFKQYAHTISKIVLPTLSEKEKNTFQNIEILPIKGLDTFEIVKLFPKSFVKKNVKRIFQKVLKLFLHNVENKDGNVIYESLLFYSFDEWKGEVWPLFLNDIKSLECDGEFFQSLVKYWIPSNVSTYRTDFYEFLKDEDVDNKLKAYVLLESKKRGFVDHIHFSDDVLPKFYDIETTSIALKIVSTYHKKSICPTVMEMSTILNYLYSNLNAALIDEDVKSLYLFLSQLFLHAHADLPKSNENLLYYCTFLEKVYKYCYSCLETCNFEVAAQVLLIIRNISTGSYKSLKLYYKVEKRDMYEEGQNLLYKELQRNGLWNFDSDEFYKRLKSCFWRNKASGTNLTKLCVICTDKINFINPEAFMNILQTEGLATLQNTEQIKNCAHVLFKNETHRADVLVFLKEISQFLLDNLILTESDYSKDAVLYKNVVLFEILLVAMKNKFQINEFYERVEKALKVIGYILENNFSGNRSYKSSKILEAFVNSIMCCIIQDKDALWQKMNKTEVIYNLIKIIQRSNMKRPVSLSIEVLKHFGSKMEETESDTILKIHFLDATLKSIYKNPVKQELKIRRSPETRLVIHALCSQNKTFLKWIIHSLLDVISDPHSSDPAISSALHSIEILVSDNALQTDMLPFIQNIFVNCVELFAKTSWIVRNADLQLAKALIERFYGVSLSLNNRPKNILDLFLIFPELSVYFLKILSLEELDERSILVFQFFFESQIRNQVFNYEITKINRDCFLAVFASVIKRYPNNYGKLAVRSYVSLCTNKEIPNFIVDVTDYVKINFRVMQKNIFANFALLLQELYEKYKDNSDCTNTVDFIKIHFALDNLLLYLRKFDTTVFNFLLFKVTSVKSVLTQFAFLDNKYKNGFEKRLWVHNNLPFLLKNAKPQLVSSILDKILTNELVNCVQIKLLSILVQRLEKGEFSNENISDVVGVLFRRSVLVDDCDNYLLNCYFKTILLFCEKNNSVNLSNVPINFTHTSNLYKLMIYVIYFSKQSCEQEDFYKTVETNFMNRIGIQEEIDNDIMSTLRYFKDGAPKNFRCPIFKLAFYGAIHYSTYVEAYNFICYITKRGYTGIVSALNDFLSIKTLMVNLEDEEIVKTFLVHISKFVDSLPERSEGDDGYYAVESDYLVSKLFLEKLLKFCVENT